jgi:hypothetical protein
MQREEARQRHEHDLAKQAEIAAQAAADAERAAAEQVAYEGYWCLKSPLIGTPNPSKVLNRPDESAV